MVFSEADFHGATPEEIIGVINYVSGSDETVWVANGDQRMGTACIAGITLRVRQLFHERGLTRLSINGNGWMVAFNVTARRPRNLSNDIVSLTTSINLASHPSVSSKGASAMVSLHGLTVVSPEELRKEMALLRLFNSEWA